MKNHATGRWTIGRSRSGTGGTVSSGYALSLRQVWVFVVVIIAVLGLAVWGLGLSL
ncbi:MAG: hypothetical protein WA082_03455 [Candidatus Moraniibacteriota bacterium]